MEYLPVFGLMFIVVAFISWRWVVGIEYMHKNHPDYKGEDFLNWGDDEHQRAAAGRDGWDSIDADDDWHPDSNI